MNPLQHRLAALRRRLRFVVTFRGACWLGGLLVLAVVLAGLLDWRVHLPGAVRALVLAGTLGGAGYLAYRQLVRPLAAPADDLALALRVEERYPELNDALASAVQFLEHTPQTVASGVASAPRVTEYPELGALTRPRSPTLTRPRSPTLTRPRSPTLTRPRSPTMESEAVRRAMEQVEEQDFTRVVDERGVRPAWLLLLTAGAVAAALCVWQPALARTALLRLADPFGAHEWPRQTQLAIQAEHRAARGEAFSIYGVVRGVVPEKATVTYHFADDSKLEQVCDIAQHAKPDEGCFTARLDADRVRQPFRFQVRTNDAVSEWRSVVVVPPPRLAPLDGRPSPLVSLRYPAYSDLPDVELPDGATSIEALAGTVVTLRAATDLPAARAWLEFPAELTPAVDAAAAVGCLGVPPVQAAARVTLTPRTTRRIPADVRGGGRLLALEFVARVSGVFVLHLEDDTGLGSNRLFEVRVIPDPVPTVQLERPTRSLDSFDVLPGAEVTLQVLAEDPQFALRTVWVDYRVTRGEGQAAGENGRLLLFDHAAAGRIVSVASGVALAPRGLPALTRPGSPAVLPRPQRVQLTRRWSLKPLNLKEGDVIRLQAFADDFDDVTANKPPGRSHEVELRVVGRTALEQLLHEWQMQVQQELQRLARLQQDALKNVISAESALRNRGRLEPKHVDEVVQAEQRQQQLRARVGSLQEGLRAEVARILQALRDNELPRGGARDRLETTAAELQRLAREHLDQVEPRLTETRKELDGARNDKPDGEDRSRRTLAAARAHQEEIRRTLQSLLKLLEPWSSTSEVKGEARALLEEQRGLAREVDRLGRDIPPGTTRADLKRAQRQLETEARKRGKLTEEQRMQLDQLKTRQGALDRTAEFQTRLAEQVDDLLGKMERGGRASPHADSDSAQELREAAELGRKADAAGELRAAGQSVRAAELGKAGAQQRRGTQALEQIVQALEEKGAAELDRLAKKLQAAEEQLGKLAQAQDRLREETRAAAAQADLRDRARELHRLSREQKKLLSNVEDTLRELTRLRRPEAQRNASQAGDQMEQATRRMEAGGNPEAQQKVALDRLDDARRDVSEARQAAEQELAREKLAKLTDQIKGIRDRQESQLEESVRIHQQVLQRKQWTRGLLTSLRDLARTQTQLGQETASLADGKTAGAEVFAYLLKRTATVMEQAAERARQRCAEALRRSAADAVLNEAVEGAEDEATRQLQQAALRALDHLLEALKPEPGLPTTSAGGGEGTGGQGDQGGGLGRAPGDGMPPLAELKALKTLQQDLNERTGAFARKHPDTKKLGRAEQAELDALRQEQQKIAELFHKITSALMKEGEQP